MRNAAAMIAFAAALSVFAAERVPVAVSEPPPVTMDAIAAVAPCAYERVEIANLEAVARIAAAAVAAGNLDAVRRIVATAVRLKSLAAVERAAATAMGRFDYLDVGVPMSRVWALAKRGREAEERGDTVLADRLYAQLLATLQRLEGR